MGRKEEVKREGDGLFVQWFLAEQEKQGLTNFSHNNFRSALLWTMDCDVIRTLLMRLATDS